MLAWTGSGAGVDQKISTEPQFLMNLAAVNNLSSTRRYILSERTSSHSAREAVDLSFIAVVRTRRQLLAFDQLQKIADVQQKLARDYRISLTLRTDP